MPGGNGQCDGDLLKGFLDDPLFHFSKRGGSRIGAVKNFALAKGGGGI